MVEYCLMLALNRIFRYAGLQMQKGMSSNSATENIAIPTFCTYHSLEQIARSSELLQLQSLMVDSCHRIEML